MWITSYISKKTDVMSCKSQPSLIIDAIDFTSTGTQIFGPFFESPILLDEFVLIKIGSQIALTPLRNQKHRGLRYPHLDVIQLQISSLQQSIAEIEILKAGKFWRENGEKSAGFLKRSATTRENKRSIIQLRDPESNTLCTDPLDLERIASNFYKDLFTPTEPDSPACRAMFNAIPPELKLTQEQQEGLLGSFHLAEILEESKRTPRKSSPGPDGLPYEILYLVMQFPPYHEIITQVYNDALDKGKFPRSWNDSLMTLLYKKGARSEMKNYRPLSLANTDYKLFTRIVNRRIMEVATGLISRHQLGFIPGRFIAENGMICHLIMEDAQRKWKLAVQQGTDPYFRTIGHDIGLLLDQEKAYDRVNLNYLKKVLRKFGFPKKMIDCVYRLMADNLIRININGYLSEAIPKLRGLKQGDPLSPILYNLAFEPFLLAILHDKEFQGYMMGNHRTKLLCYADDALVFVHNTQDLSRLETHMTNYCLASNAKFNNDKVQAFSVSGRNTWYKWNRHLPPMKITHIHSVEDEDPLTYLGFPLIQNRTQRMQFMASLITKLKTAVEIHSTRSLSVVGKATVLNSLILSKLWYLLRVMPLTKSEFAQLRSVAIQFLKRRIFPVIPWGVWTLSKAKGGLGVIDIQLQASALYFRWLQPLLVLSLPEIDQHPVYYLLSYHLKNVNQRHYHLIPLLFPCTRTQGLKQQRVGVLDMLYKAIDSLPHSFASAQVSPATLMVLPLQVAFYTEPTTPYPLPGHVKTMFVSDVFQYDSRLNFIHWKDTRDPSLKEWKRAPKVIFKGLATGKLKFQPFFQPSCSPAPVLGDPSISFKPFVDQYSLKGLPSIASPLASAKIFRRTVQASCIAPATLRAISAAHWKYFWSLSLTAVQRNVIYRLITGHIPHLALLHRWMPNFFDSPLCPVCLVTNDSADHLLFYCPVKQTVWQGMIFEFLWPTTTISDIKSALSSLDFSPLWYCQKEGITPLEITIITLSQIWLAHMRFVFDKTPISHSAIIASIRLNVQKNIDQDSVHSLL